VHAYSFVRSPITIQSGSHIVEQRRSSDHILGLDVTFSVLVVYENLLTFVLENSGFTFNLLEEI